MVDSEASYRSRQARAQKPLSRDQEAARKEIREEVAGERKTTLPEDFMEEEKIL